MQASPNDYIKAAQLLKDKGYAIIEVTKDISDATELFLKKSKEFFEKESTEKQKCTSASGLDMGYQGVGDVREGFQIRLSESIHDIWNNNKDYKFASEECFQKLNSIAEKILKAMVESLGMEWEQVTVALDKYPLRNGAISSSVLDCWHYFNKNEKVTEPCRAHTDAGLLTLIPCAKVAGLQILSRISLEWIDIESILQSSSRENILIVFCGDTIARFSNNIIPATIHRVVKNQTARMSCVFKQRARPDIVGPRSDADYKIAEILQKASSC